VAPGARTWHRGVSFRIGSQPMILRRIKLTGFKKFTDAEFEFGPSINLFLGPNEAGKSTIQQAIITALYGIKNKSAGLLSSRDEARSWNPTGQCRLELEYDVNGSEFLLRRDISSSKVKLLGRDSPEDKWRLVSEASKNVAHLIAEQMGINSAYVFSRTISVSQTDMAMIDETDKGTKNESLRRIGENIEEVFTGEAHVSPDKAIEFIDRNYRKAFRQKDERENTGRLDRLETRLSELVEQLKQAREDERERLVLASRLDLLDHEIPIKNEELLRVQNLKDKARQRKEIGEKLQRARVDFRAVNRRIEQIHKAQAELSQLDEQRKAMGPIGDMDPEQLLTRQRELDAKHWRAGSRAEQCRKELDAENVKLEHAIKTRKELQEVEDKIDSYGPVASENLDEVDDLREEIVEKIREVEAEKRTEDERICDMSAHIQTLEKILQKHPDLEDPSAAFDEWHKCLSRRNEAHGQLNAAERELADHSDREPVERKRWLIALLVGLAVLSAGIAGMILSWSASLPVLIIGIVIVVASVADKTVGRMRLREWQKVYQRLAESVSSTRDIHGQAEVSIVQFAGTIGVPEDEVEAALMEHRDAELEKTRLTQGIERCRRERGKVSARHDALLEESRQLAARFGCDDLDQLRECCIELRKLSAVRKGLLDKILTIFGAPATRDAIGLIDEAYGKIKLLSDERKQLEADVARIEGQQDELLERTDCEDQADLTRQAEALKGLIIKRKEARARLDTMLGNKTLAELSDERAVRNTTLAELSGRLDENFAGFEPTIEQAEQWQTDYENLTEELEALRAERNQVDGRLKALTERPGPSPAELEGEKHFIEKEIQRGDEIVEAARLAVSILREVKSAHHAEYLPPLEKAATRQFSAMTNGRYHTVKLAESWPRVFVSDSDHSDIEPEHLSRGTADQLYFALRLAACEKLSRHTALPLILDDPFSNFDPDRLALGMDILKMVAAEGRQVIFFTHDPREAECEQKWREAGIPVNHVDVAV